MPKSKVFSGVLWASIQRFGNVAISFMSTMVMARLLTPSDFGTIGMLTFFLSLAQTFVDSGFGSALIQRKRMTYVDSCTVFYTNMSLSILFYIILFLSAPAIARFYNIEIVCPLLRVMGLSIIIQGFTIIQSTLFQKEMNFKTLSICNLSGSVILAAIGIAAALLGFGVWSFVIRAIAGTIVTSCMLWLFSKWRPSIIFSRKSFIELFNFGGFILLSSLCTTISNNIQPLIIGKLFAPNILGNYTQARSLRNIPSDTIQQIISQVLYPDFSKYQDCNNIIRDKLNKSIYLISYLIVPIMFLCILLAQPLILICFGEKWLDIIPYFQIFCIGGIPYCLQDVNINVIKSKGHSGWLFSINIIKVMIYIALTIISSLVWGIYGLLWVSVVYTTLAYICFAILGTHCIHTNILAQLKNIIKCILFAAIPFILAYWINNLLCHWCSPLRIIIVSVLFLIIYISISAIFKSTALHYLIKQFARVEK